MYDSQEDSPKKSLSSSVACRMPSNQFRISFQPSNDFEKGMGVAVIVDGVLCTSKESASILMEKRLGDLFGQWTEQVAKM